MAELATATVAIITVWMLCKLCLKRTRHLVYRERNGKQVAQCDECKVIWK